MREAIDDEEARSGALGDINVVARWVTCCAAGPGARSRGWVLPGRGEAVHGIIFWQTAVVQRRAMARRHALEAARDPIGAAKRRRRELWQCRAGMVIGALGGFGGLIGGLLASGRIAF